MKKLMLVMGLMAIAAFTYAGENATGISNEVKIEKYSDAVMPAEKDDALCTVSQTAKATIYFVEYSVTCTATEVNCKLAISAASGCVTEAFNRIRSVIK